MYIALGIASFRPVSHFDRCVPENIKDHLLLRHSSCRCFLVCFSSHVTVMTIYKLPEVTISLSVSRVPVISAVGVNS